ncbi:MAG: PQQ-dependent sugar dehydrogenase [Ignavibacteria bacterium]
MKKFLAVFFLLLLVINAHSQYSLVPAFPNLPAFQAPLELVHSNDVTNRLFLVQEWGLIYLFKNNPSVNTKKVFLDLTDKIATFAQTGILGIAFHPNFQSNKYFYVHYIYENESQTGFVTRISRFTASSVNPDTAYSSSEVILMDLPVEYPGHYGGKICFGPDGYLYISLGDAGTGASGGHLAQDLTSLRGKILRIDVNSTSGGMNYSIPVSNPFFSNSQGYKKEIYAYGFRNMWKFSFDLTTNVLWGADVGEHLFEEIDHVEKGKNYGWNKMEGFHCYNWPDTTLCDTAGRGYSRPIFEYPHAVGKSITGGYVYRGSKYPELYGKYIYGDFVKGIIWSLSYPSLENNLILDTTFNISAFGVDQQNEIYIVSYSGVIYNLYRAPKTLNLSAVLEGFYNMSDNKMAKDTVTVYLRNATPPYLIVDSVRSLLDSNGNGSFTFYNAINSTPYYIVLSHRNSLEVWSSSGKSFASNSLNYNFTTSSSQSYGNNTMMVDNQPIRFALYSGDVNQDGHIDLTDILQIKNDAQLFTTGYSSSDLEGNDFVDLADILIAYNNTKRFVQEITP